MKGNRYTIALLSVIIVCLLAAPAMAGDHGGADWTPANGAEITGVHYNIGTFTVAGGTTVGITHWNEATGDDGFVQIYADTINIAGTLNGDAKGYLGGAGAGHYYYGGPGGANWYPEPGTGDGGTHNEVDGAGQYPTANHRLSSGGGGGYGGEGGLGCSYWTTYSGVGDAAGGDAFGTPDTYQLKIGASGAGGGGGYEIPYKWGGKGGDGGAGILLSAETITITGAITVDGEDGEDGESGYKGCGGGGGGAGGCILIYAGTLTGDGSLYADAGDGGDSGDGSIVTGGHAAGGAGGGAGGRIKIWYNTSTFSGSHSVMNGSGGAHGEAMYGHGLDGYPGEEGTYHSNQYDEDCLGTCYNGTICEGDVIAENVTCWACLVEADRSWENYEFESPCNPGYMVPRLCYDYCPECCDGTDNDSDGFTDWPNDPECACCLDETEATDEGCPVPCVPELATFTLVGIGLMMFAGVVYRRKE